MNDVSYAVDACDCLLWLGASWATVARANDAPHLADGLLGRSLWEFIDGKTTR